VISLLVKLAIASGILPRDLFIRGVDLGRDPHPHAFGGFADVFLGRLDSQQVAVKCLRVSYEEQVVINPVRPCIPPASTFSWYALDGL
jgi:hypothetical protein